MENKIITVTEDMIFKQQTNLGKIVKCVLHVLDSVHSSKSSPVTLSSIENCAEEPIKQAQEEDISLNCEYCSFECEHVHIKNIKIWLKVNARRTIELQKRKKKAKKKNKNKKK